MQRYIIAIIPLIAFATQSPTAWPKPAVNIKKETYNVRGYSAQEIRADLDRKTPILKNNVRFDALTEWRVEWEFFWYRSKEYCEIDALTTQVKIRYVLPELKTLHELPTPLKKRWNSYYDALLSHEEGHKDIALLAAREIEKSFAKIGPRSSCDELMNETSIMGQRIIDKHIELNEHYDKATDHGSRNGAKFP